MENNKNQDRIDVDFRVMKIFQLNIKNVTEEGAEKIIEKSIKSFNRL